MSRRHLLEIDALATRYKVLPSEMKNIDLSDYQFNVLVAFTAISEEAKQQKKMLADMKAKGRRK